MIAEESQLCAGLLKWGFLAAEEEEERFQIFILTAVRRPGGFFRGWFAVESIFSLKKTNQDALKGKWHEAAVFELDLALLESNPRKMVDAGTP